MVKHNIFLSFIDRSFEERRKIFHLQIFKSKLQARQKGRVAMQIDSSTTSKEISFHGLPSKSKRPSIRKQIVSSLSSLIVSLFLRNSHLQRDVQQTCFCQYFCELLKNSCSASENFQKIHKKLPWRSLILVKLQAFTEAATEGVPPKKCSLGRCLQNSQENTCVRHFNKLQA